MKYNFLFNIALGQLYGGTGEHNGYGVAINPSNSDNSISSDISAASVNEFIGGATGRNDGGLMCLTCDSKTWHDCITHGVKKRCAPNQTRCQIEERKRRGRVESVSFHFVKIKIFVITSVRTCRNKHNYLVTIKIGTFIQFLGSYGM